VIHEFRKRLKTIALGRPTMYQEIIDDAPDEGYRHSILAKLYTSVAPLGFYRVSRKLSPLSVLPNFSQESGATFSELS
jgi:hypothetical protein